MAVEINHIEQAINAAEYLVKSLQLGDQATTAKQKAKWDHQAGFWLDSLFYWYRRGAEVRGIQV